MDDKRREWPEEFPWDDEPSNNNAWCDAAEVRKLRADYESKVCELGAAELEKCHLIRERDEALAKLELKVDFSGAAILLEAERAKSAKLIGALKNILSSYYSADRRIAAEALAEYESK